MKTELTGAQVRMARAFLRWSVTELAKRANVGISTVQRIEAADDPAVYDDLDWRVSARGKSIQAIRETLIRAGITLLPDCGRGVGVRGKARKGRARSPWLLPPSGSPRRSGFGEQRNGRSGKLSR